MPIWRLVDIPKQHRDDIPGRNRIGLHAVQKFVDAFAHIDGPDLGKNRSCVFDKPGVGDNIPQ